MTKNELTTISQLDVHERKRLKELTAKVDKWHADGMEIIWPVLEEIRSDKLYRETHDTFEAFCRDRWDWGRNYVNKMISANEVRQSLGTIVPKLAETITTESQLRELVAVPDDELPAVAEALQEKIEAGEKITAKAIKQVVAELAPAEPEKTKPAPKPADPQEVKSAAIQFGEKFVRAIDDLNTVKRFHDHLKAVKAAQSSVLFIKGDGEGAFKLLRELVKG